MRKLPSPDGYSTIIRGENLSGYICELAIFYQVDGRTRVKFLEPVDKPKAIEILELVYGPIARTQEAEYHCGCAHIPGYWVCPSHGQGLKI